MEKINRSWAEKLGFFALMEFAMRFTRRKKQYQSIPTQHNPEIEAAAAAKRQRRCLRNLREYKLRQDGWFRSLMRLQSRAARYK